MSANFRAPTQNSSRRHVSSTFTSPEQSRSSRLPTRTGISSSTSHALPNSNIPHVSQMAKRTSRTITPGERSEYSTTTGTTKKMSAPIATTQKPTASSVKRTSLLPSSHIASAKIPARSTSRAGNDSSSIYAPVPPVSGTPTLMSATMSSTHDGSRSNGLRRKPSTIATYAATRHAETPVSAGNDILMNQIDGVSRDTYDHSVLGISIPSTDFHNRSEEAVRILPEPKARFTPDNPQHQDGTRVFSPLASGYAPSVTPSTRYTDSPFSHVPTPSSASSYASAPIAPTTASKSRTRPPTPTRSRPPASSRPSGRTESSRLGMPSVRESSTSSSNATIKPATGQRTVCKEVSPESRPSIPAVHPVELTRPTSRGKLVKSPPQRKVSTVSKKEPMVPPELAHLNIDPPPPPAAQKSPPPPRPSRDGTPLLHGMNDQPSLVMSELAPVYATYHKRTPSQEVKANAVNSLPSLRSRFGFSKSPSKTTSPRIDSAMSPPPPSQTFSRALPSSDVSTDMPRLTRKDSPAIGPSPTLAKQPRFGFFHRKHKEEPQKPTEKPRRPPSKGPAAGTGHEGYGKFNARTHPGATNNTGTSTRSVRSSSADSNSSAQSNRTNGNRKGSIGSRRSKDSSDEMDDFLRERLQPIRIRGSAGSTESNATGSIMPRDQISNSSKTSLDSLSESHTRPSAISHKVGPPSSSRANARIRRLPSDSSADDVVDSQPTLAARRSLNRISQNGDDKIFIRVPAPINTQVTNKKGSIDSYDAETSAGPQTDASLPFGDDPVEGKEGLWLRPLQSKTSNPRVKSPSKWNFFQRTHTPAVSTEDVSRDVQIDLAPAETNPHYPYSGVAHYTMDPVVPVGWAEVEKIIYENTSADESMSESNAPSRFAWPERRQTKLLPPPPKPEYPSDIDFRRRLNPPAILVRYDSAESQSPELLRATTTVPLERPQIVNIERSPALSDVERFPSPMMPTTATRTSMDVQRKVYTPDQPHDTPLMLSDTYDSSPQRIPRLSPVGRIPQVKSNRDRPLKASDTSFSRPFDPMRPKPTVKPPGELYKTIRDLASPVLDGTSQPVSGTSTRAEVAGGILKNNLATDLPNSAANRASMDLHSNHEFLFMPRKDSNISYSSSSGTYSFMPITAPAPQMEDTWYEYDDFLDEMMLPSSTPLATGPFSGAPYQFPGNPYDQQSLSMPSHLNWAPALLPQLDSHMQLPQHPEILSIPQQINRFMQPSMSPLSSPHDLMSHYGTRSTSTLMSNNRSSIPVLNGGVSSNVYQTIGSGDRVSVGSSGLHSHASWHSRSASLPEGTARNSRSSLTSSARFRRDTQLLDIAEVDVDSPSSMANLRFGALMTSKWLSFDRVLFSPAHNEMRLADEPRVLILDGMGGDWSYYVALSYPSASVYNLGPSPPNGQSAWPGVNQKPPPNHRHIHHSAIDAAFPFPKGFFTAVVFRFPRATTDDAYHACLFECKRVLRPGGYLEVAVLDLDLMNAGRRARQAIRGLKTRLQQADANVSLRNLSDSIVRLLGRRGFEEIQRCTVGVPAAGRIPRSTDASSDCSQASINVPAQPVWAREEDDLNMPSTSGPMTLGEKEFSFADLLEDARVNQMTHDNDMIQSTGYPNEASIPASGGRKGSTTTAEHERLLTRMVAKVGRWWYTTCYEQDLRATGDRSIWLDAPLLRECEKQGTSFRLLICYAQKPVATRRRTVSV